MPLMNYPPCIGLDGIHSNHLKLGGNALKSFLSRLFSSFICHGHIPELLLKGEIRPIIKNALGDKHSSENYRPIMSSSTLLKTFEYCLLFKLKRHVKLNTRQFGFRKNTSCLMAATVFKETIYNYNVNNSNVHAAFLDLSKAFDKVNHNILLMKLINQNIPPLLIKTLKSMYSNQSVHVSFNNTKSNPWILGNGVRQGAVLSPLLFSVYINDILKTITELNTGCSIGYYKTNLIGFADDIVISAPSAIGLQILLDTISKMFDALCLKINLDKSSYMCFLAKKFAKHVTYSKIYLNNPELKRVTHCKYLGIILTDRLNNNLDIKKCNNQFLKQFYGMFRKFSYLNSSILSFLFSSYCTSFYGSQLWYNRRGCQNEFRALGVSYHNHIKKMLRIPLYESNHVTCEGAGLPIFKHCINKRTLSFFISLITSNSPCILPLRYYFKYDSEILYCLKSIFRKVYHVTDILSNDFRALYATIDFVERHEPRSHYRPNR